MTAVEFHDRTPIENAISSLTTTPDKIIFIGDGNAMGKFRPDYEEFLIRRDKNVELEYRPIKKDDINDIVRVLTEIAEQEKECVFDLTGGEDLVLVAMGMVYQKYANSRDKSIKMQRLNVRSGVVRDCDNDGKVICDYTPKLSVEENIKINGGAIRFSQDGGTFLWDMSEDFCSDINKMWEICRKNPGKWNSQLNILEFIEKHISKASLKVSVDLFALKDQTKRQGLKYTPIDSLLRGLASQELISSLEIDEYNASFVYKNEQVKKCLVKAGTVFELKMYLSAIRATDKNGAPSYSDYMNGVYIDWDGKIPPENQDAKDTENEIDILLMKGLMPIFVSCKNGSIDDDELYKLDSVTSRFGGKYAKKVLLATYLGKGRKSMDSFRRRAKDMKITLIEDIHKMNDAQINKIIRNLINL